jgi:hypothetical protein
VPEYVVVGTEARCNGTLYWIRRFEEKRFRCLLKRVELAAAILFVRRRLRVREGHVLGLRLLLYDS